MSWSPSERLTMSAPKWVWFVVFVLALHTALVGNFDNRVGIYATIGANGHRQESARAGIAREKFPFDDEAGIAGKQA